MERIQKSKESQATEEEEIQDVPVPEVDPEIEEHKHHSDDLLDQIDAILEENAEAFVKGYIQGGGE